MVMSINSGSFSQLYTILDNTFKKYANKVTTESWQGRKTDGKPDMVTHELLNMTMGISLYDAYGQALSASQPFNLDHWRNDCKPHLPWADNHFLERVSGAPLNPGSTYQDWRHGASASTFLAEQRNVPGVKNNAGPVELQFNHTYMERMWPKVAGRFGPLYTAEEFELKMPCPESEFHLGIRGERYGDLYDLVRLLDREPHTRQAYLPLYFPEDTGAPGRKPCTLGYQFILRNQRLHCYYPMRSCDYANHFRDDCYLAVRLLLWIINELRTMDPLGIWNEVMPGSLTIHCTSFHLFANDYIALCKEESNLWKTS